MRKPFWMLFAKGLRLLMCDHKGVHEEWGYRFGSGICEQYCSKCGKPIRKIPLDDLPKDTLLKLLKLLHEDNDDKPIDPD